MIQNIYLDNGATTKVADEVAEAMNLFLTGTYGNASSLHSFGRKAKIALEEARVKIARAINADSSEIIFTGGGTESNNTALKVVARLMKKKGRSHIVTSKVEHPSVLNACKALEREGFEVSYVNVDSKGIINIEELKKAVKDKTAIVSIMHANNEIGTIQPLEEIGRICRSRKIYLHTDAVQSFTKTKLDVKRFNVDLASFSAHKLHGPKGIGALYVRKGTDFEAFLHGGHQEGGRRAGTENIPAIAGFGKAVEISNETDLTKMKELRDYTIGRILNEIKNARLNGDAEKRLANNINISFDYIEGESLLMQLDDMGIAVSTGSACSSHSLEPSHVLLAMGLKPEEAHGSIRITLSRYTTKEELDYTLECLKKAVANLRQMSPLGEQNVQ